MRRLRESAGLTQMAVAAALSVSQAAYSRLEKGEIEVSVSRLFVLSELYGISLQQLIAEI
jgi:transcriptional regulator with XRE-family HTH domain